MIDWNKLLENLAKRRPMIEIACKSGLTIQQLRALRAGETTEPPFSAGVLLLDMHYDTCPKKHHQLMEWD